ncbi:MAG: DUF1501 domain-containing protein [Lapillicoccus sp.]
MLRRPQTGSRTHAEALLADDVIVPMHAHDERDDHFVSLVDTTPRRVSPAEAAHIASTRHGIGGPRDLTDVAEGGPRKLSRRNAIRGGAALLGGLLAPNLLPRYSFAATGARDTVIVIFLRGGMDGPSALVPVTDPSYYAARGEVAVPAELTLPVTADFGLHPEMAPLMPLWDADQLAFVTGVGAPWASRSHFVDQVANERCAPAQVRSGWLGRHLASASSDTGTLRAVTIGSKSTLAVATSFPTLATWTVDGFDLPAAADRRDAAMRTLDSMYGAVGGVVNAQAEATFASIGTLASVRGTPYSPSAGAVYPASNFGSGLAEIARLMKAGVGMEAACIDIGDWDMHQNFGVASDTASKFSGKVRDLSEGLAALRTDLGDRWATTTVITMSEFGRRVLINGSGFDHGSGGLMIFAGGGVNGGKVYGSQPTLSLDNLRDGDMPITVDFRQPLSEVVTTRLANSALETVFPGFTAQPPLGIV